MAVNSDVSLSFSAGYFRMPHEKREDSGDEVGVNLKEVDQNTIKILSCFFDSAALVYANAIARAVGHTIYRHVVMVALIVMVVILPLIQAKAVFSVNIPFTPEQKAALHEIWLIITRVLTTTGVSLMLLPREEDDLLSYTSFIQVIMVLVLIFMALNFHFEKKTKTKSHVERSTCSSCSEKATANDSASHAERPYLPQLSRSVETADHIRLRSDGIEPAQLQRSHST